MSGSLEDLDLSFTPEAIAHWREDARLFAAAEEPGLFKQLGAAFDRFNTVSLFEDVMRRPTFEADPAFRPQDHLSYAELKAWGSTYMTARSAEELDWLRRERERLDALDRMLAGGPLHPIIPGLVASIIDPVNLLPLGWVGAIARGAGVASRVGQGAAVGAAANLLVEPLFQQADPFRDTLDAVADILVGGVIGAGLGGVAAVLGRRGAGPLQVEGIAPERVAEVRAHVREALDDLNAPHAEAAGVPRAGEVGRPAGEVGRPAGSPTAGAMAADQAGIVVRALRAQASEMAGPRWLQKAGQWLAKSNLTRYPGWTLASSRFASSRMLIADIADIGIYTKAGARQMTEADFRAAYPDAVREGFVGTEADFIAEARRRADAGLAMTDGLPVFTEINTKLGRFADVADAFEAGYREAREAGYQGTRDQFDTDLVRAARYAEEPQRFAQGDPFAGSPAAPAMKRVLDQWRKLADAALKDIQRSGVWRDVVDPALPRGNYFPKGLNRENVLADLAGFQRTWEAQLRRMVDAARQNIEGYDKALDAFNNRVQAQADFTKAARQAQIARKDPKGLLRPLMRAMFAERRAARDFERLRSEIKDTTGAKNIMDWHASLAERRARGETIEPWEINLEARLERLAIRRDQAGIAYEGMRKRAAAEIKAITGLEPPPVRAVRPEKPPGYDKAKRLVDQEDAGEFSVQAEAARITQDVAFGADPNRFLDVGVRANLKGRGLDMDPEAFAAYFEPSFLRAVENYNSMVARDTAIFKKFGTLDAAEPARRIMDEAARLQGAAKTDAERAAIARDAVRDVELVENLLAKARGTFDRATSAEAQRARGVINTAMQINYMARMGSGLLAQLGDVATSVLRYGGGRVFGAHLSNFARGLALTREIKGRAREVSTALDAALNDQQRLLFDVAPSAHVGPVGRVVNRAVPMFSKLTLMPAWNDGVRKMGVVIVDDILVRAARDLNAGRTIHRDAADLFSRAGVSLDTLKPLARVLEQNHTRRAGPKELLDSNLEMWAAAHPELADVYRGLLHLGGQRSLLLPGAADAPFWTQKALGVMVMQFKRFVMAGLPQQLVPFLQSPAGRKLEVAIFGLAMGALSTTLRDLVARGELRKRNGAAWVLDSMDMSGIMSMLTETDATLDKIFPGVSAKRMLTGETYSRFQERTRIMQLLGPTAGLVEAAGRAAVIPYRALHPDLEVDREQIRALRTILPYQNHLMLRHGIDVLEAYAGGRQNSILLDWIDPNRSR